MMDKQGSTDDLVSPHPVRSDWDAFQPDHSRDDVLMQRRQEALERSRQLAKRLAEVILEADQQLARTRQILNTIHHVLDSRDTM